MRGRARGRSFSRGGGGGGSGGSSTAAGRARGGREDTVEDRKQELKKPLTVYPAHPRMAKFGTLTSAQRNLAHFARLMDQRHQANSAAWADASGVPFDISMGDHLPACLIQKNPFVSLSAAEVACGSYSWEDLEKQERSAARAVGMSGGRKPSALDDVDANSDAGDQEADEFEDDFQFDYDDDGAEEFGDANDDPEI
eukprot:NODE_4074_length_866_cov_23.993880_g3759_i0.p1 GENE.NODE_4074_length_866_cov_23.993880_g3759_i0~~NODE_4074_length_866_cov_23.993880_g3759_i0.p1  ORF type:complete len:197 (-),score=31.42 NODE_4074_length_866_cov_23.993880_g3759_i0:137-727(-)